jgi:hypothetical protein
MINETLYKFNKNKLKELLLHPQFSYLLFKFLEDEKAVRQVYKRSTSSTADSAYTNLIDAMKKRC